ncbi:FG-GAP repeat domain-containing protein [Rubrivirga sp. IMCC43871]|uniref:FG-GAP repeat domain-containing protein n=1 Tax=Rubrivirga sp. IMCC43871 TaxID=3391575 RepID=UPI00398FE8CC
MRSLALLLALAGCRADAPEPLDPAPFVPVAEAHAPIVEPEFVADSLARGPYGFSLAPDTLAALVAAVDTSARGVELIGGAGIFHDGEVSARSGERWQGLYPTADGVEIRSFALTIDTAQDPVLDDDAGPFTGVRVTTPFSTFWIDEDFPADSALALVRRPGASFADGPVPTAFVGAWPVRSGHLSLALGDQRVSLLIVEGPEAIWMPQRQRVRPDRVLLVDDGETRQPISAIIGGDDGHPALLWAGDLDGDGRLDLLVDESNHYNLGAPALFLSSAAGPGQLVRRVARHEAVGC